MHEYSIVRSLLDRVREEVSRRDGTRVFRLWVRIGELSGVEIDLLQTAYDVPGAHAVRARADGGEPAGGAVGVPRVRYGASGAACA